MTSPKNFTAGSSTRSLAYLFDLATVAFVFIVVYALGDALNLKLDDPMLFAALVFVYQAYFLAARTGATPGKYVRNVCVIAANGEPLVLGQAVARGFLTAFPYACLAAGAIHIDPIAHGLVSMVPVFGVAYLFVDLVLLEYTHARRTLTDILTRTLVVKLPPIQPHRAPAVPMFSANDAEFGNPPRLPPSE